MFGDARRHSQLVHFLGSDLFRVAAQDQMDLVRGGIDLVEQTLQVDRSAGAGGGDDELHELVEKIRKLYERRQCESCSYDVTFLSPFARLLFRQDQTPPPYPLPCNRSREN